MSEALNRRRSTFFIVYSEEDSGESEIHIGALVGENRFTKLLQFGAISKQGQLEGNGEEGSKKFRIKHCAIPSRLLLSS